MAKNFPHINDTTFPNASNVNPYAFQNNFDFSQYADTQMKIKVMSVPWDLGEVHVGLKSIPLGNVVAFESEAERNEWLDKQPGIAYETRYRSYHDKSEIKLPIPYEQVILNNYIVIDYEPIPGTEQDVNRISRWLFFIREAEAESINSTVCRIQRDSWTMFCQDIDINYLLLERGHAPMFAAPTPEAYLEAPIDGNEYLLTEDYNYGEASRTNEASRVILNDGEIWACIATSADVTKDWGLKGAGTWNVPATTGNTQDGNLAPNVYAINPDDLPTFWKNVSSQCPQFLQTVLGVFFVPDKLVTRGGFTTFCGVKLNKLLRNEAEFELVLPSVEDFDYPEDYKKITKLYTSPYSYLELTDEEGDTREIKIEDCSGALTVRTAVSLAFPWLNVSAHIDGLGSTEKASINFKNLENNSFTYGGRWYDTLKSWNIPVMAVYQSAAEVYDYATDFDRKTEKDNAYRSADAAYTNAETDAKLTTDTADNDATLATETADNDATLTTDTASISAKAATDTAAKQAANTKSNATAANTAATSATTTQNTASQAMLKVNQSIANNDTLLGNKLNEALQAWNAGYSRVSQNIEQDAAIQSAAVGIASNFVSSTASGALTGGAAGAMVGAAMGGLSGVTTGLQTAISINESYAKTEAGITNSEKQLTATNDNNFDRFYNRAYGSADASSSADGGENKLNRLEREANSAVTTANNTARTTTAANDASTTTATADITATATKDTATKQAANIKANAKLNASNTTANAELNATATKTKAALDQKTAKDNTDESVNNKVAQAALGEPVTRGTYANGENSTTRPKGYFLNVITQSKSAIAQAATQFLRYGYRYNGMWKFNGFNIGKRYTYWKCSDLWLTAPNLPDAYVDEIRNYLLQGVTVWRKPEYINHTSITDNF